MKSELLAAYKNSEDLGSYVPTPVDTYSMIIRAGDMECVLSLFDSTGQEDLYHLRLLSYRNTDMFLIAGNLDQVDTYDSIWKRWIPEIKSYNEQTPFVIINIKDTRVIQFVTKGPKQKEKAWSDILFSLATTSGAARCIDCNVGNYESVKYVFNEVIQLLIRPSLLRRPVPSGYNIPLPVH